MQQNQIKAVLTIFMEGTLGAKAPMSDGKFKRKPSDKFIEQNNKPCSTSKPRIVKHRIQLTQEQVSYMSDSQNIPKKEQAKFKQRGISAMEFHVEQISQSLHPVQALPYSLEIFED